MPMVSHSRIRISSGVAEVSSDSDFEDSPQFGTLARRGGSMFVFCDIDGVKTWLPFSQDYSYYVHSQTVAARQWAVIHDLGTRAVWVQVTNERGEVVDPESIDTVSADIVGVTFSSETKGVAVVVASLPSISGSITTQLLSRPEGATIASVEHGLLVLDDTLLGRVMASVNDLIGAHQLGTASPLNMAAAGDDAAIGEVVRGDDSRLTDARTPTTPHTHFDPATQAEQIYADKEHSHPEYADTVHPHTVYAAKEHSHPEYADTVHPHTVYADKEHSHPEYADTVHSHPLASESPGLMSSDEKKRLDNIPYNIAASISTRPYENEKVMAFIAPRPFFISESSPSVAVSLNPMNRDYALPIYRNSDEIGEIAFSAGSSEGVFSFLSDGDQGFNAGDRLSIHAPRQQAGEDFVNIGITVSATF